MGLLPYPVQYRIVYAEPIEPVGDPDDPRRLAELSDLVKRRVQALVNAHATPEGEDA